jgi:hypothetical protein
MSNTPTRKLILSHEAAKGQSAGGRFNAMIYATYDAKAVCSKLAFIKSAIHIPDPEEEESQNPKVAEGLIHILASIEQDMAQVVECLDDVTKHFKVEEVRP